MSNRATKLESFDAPDTDHTATFTTDELTALCPFDFGGPDFYEFTLRYVPDEEAIESKSLKLYLQSYRDEEMTAEVLATTIAEDIRECIDPERLYVRLEQSRRGGIEENVEVGDSKMKVYER